jgi:hypothetical protein
MKCQECGNDILTKRNKMFCSVRCRNIVNGKNHVGCKKQVHMFCRLCGVNYTVKKSLKLTSKYCSRVCSDKSKRAIKLVN